MRDDILSRDNTLWTQGISALMIMLMHFIMETESYPRAFNILGSIGVAAFLFISGFGINESYKCNGLKSFWKKRILRVFLPCWMVFIFSLPFKDEFDSSQFFHNLIFTDSDLWFVDYILRWYAIYWISRRFFPRHTSIIIFISGIYFIFQQQLYSEQAFSFACGYIVSEYYQKVKSTSLRSTTKYSALLTAYGIAFLLLKELPAIQTIKGSLLFNFILLNIKLPMAVPIIVAPYVFPSIKRFLQLKGTGKISYEMYIVHYNFMPYITGYASILFYSVISFAISYIYYKFNNILKSRNNLVYALCGVLYMGVCYTLMCKYTMRATGHFALVCIPYLLLLAGIVLLFSNKKESIIPEKLNSHKHMLFYLSVAILAVAMIAVQYHFDPLQNKVDRWSAIAYPLDYLFSGKFPYSAPTHLGGNSSPFPMWIIFHIPFYMLGNVGLSEIFSTVLFLLSVKYSYGYKAGIKATALLFICINLWYEVSVRSDLISNFMLLTTFFNLLLSRGVTFRKSPLLLSAIAGIWLSTRLSTAFPLFIMFFPYYVRLEIKKQLATLLIAAAVFALTFLPLVIWNYNELFYSINSPFSLQFRQGSPFSIICIMVCTITFSFLWKGKGDRLLLFSALILILIPVFSYGYTMYTCNDWTDIFNSRYDITYLDAALPFCVTVISTHK